jgi:hypothetical protein
MSPPGGPWKVVQDWSTTNTYNWNTTSLAPGTYNFEVWVRHSGSAGSYEATADLSFSLR